MSVDSINTLLVIPSFVYLSEVCVAARINRVKTTQVLVVSDYMLETRFRSSYNLFILPCGLYLYYLLNLPQTFPQLNNSVKKSQVSFKTDSRGQPPLCSSFLVIECMHGRTCISLIFPEIELSWCGSIAVMNNYRVTVIWIWLQTQH